MRGSPRQQPPYKEFERQVERILNLLEDAGAEVRWNDRVRDPDTTAQLRQIDVTIRRDGFLTIVECRCRNEPQDVMWIEELYGRRTSLNADAVIAVSWSGFTQTAILKAKRFGIILRTFKDLSVEEVRNWGCKRKLTLCFCEFADLTVVFRLPQKPKNATYITNEEGVGLDVRSWRELLQKTMHRLEDDGWQGQRIEFETEISAPILVSGIMPRSMSLRAIVRRVTQEVEVASVAVYRCPESFASEAEVGKFALGSSEFIESGDLASFIIDVSQIEVPPNCIFETSVIDMGRVVTMKGFEFVGLEYAFKCSLPVTYCFEVIR